MSREDNLYIRNARPNRVVFHYNGVRYLLEHRGNRQDSVALPAEAANDQSVSRWLQIGQLEKVSKESFMKLGARTVDVLPNEFLARGLRQPRGGEVQLVNATVAGAQEQDTTGARTHIADGDVHKTVREKLSPKWAGDIMTTEEELETMDFSTETANYPSKNRDSGERRQMGY